MGTPGEVERAFVFADLCGYTALTEAHGNEHAADVVERFLALATSTLGPGASILERVGDEVVIVADDAAVAVAIALALRAAVAREPLFPLVRAAVHAGGVVERVGGYVGAALNITARVAALTAPGQIVCTERVARAAPLAGVAYRALGDARLKNIHTPVTLFEVVAAATEIAHIDPVCRMQVTVDSVSTMWQGRAYHFCSEACAAAFRARPPEYVEG